MAAACGLVGCAGSPASCQPDHMHSASTAGSMSLPVLCVNNIDDEAEPLGFEWLEGCITPDAGEEDLLPAAAHCECSSGACMASTCACRAANSTLGSDLFAADGRLMPLVHGIDWDAPLHECGPACSCSGRTCPLSVVDRPPRRGLRLQKFPGKGWGVVAEEAVAKGEWLASYAGEYVTSQEAAQRLAHYDAAGHGHALLVIRLWLPSRAAAVRANVDATCRGNIARFFNHACDGGNARLVLVQRAGSLLPRAALFAAADVPAGTELTYAFGSPNCGPSGKPCMCGTSACKGFLPHDEL